MLHKKTITAYFQLTKPTIMLLVLITGATALFIEGSLVSQPLKFFLVLLGLYLTGGAANALNQYFERNVDAKMLRTQNRRPLPQGTIPPANALIFSLVIGAIGVMIFALIFNRLTALLSLGTILFYSLIYTLILKPNTSQNIVIGGIAGAMAPVGAWAAATGEMAIIPWLLFLVVFLWTPPHFWALALFYQDDYRRTGLPMMPVVKGETETLRQIVLYSIILVGISIVLFVLNGGWLYLPVAIILGFLFIKKSITAAQKRSEKHYRSLFGFSIIYLFALFFTIIIDALLIRVILPA
jgi:protoheme IX farnesyltransferase